MQLNIKKITQLKMNRISEQEFFQRRQAHKKDAQYHSPSEMQIRTTVSEHLTPIRMAISKNSQIITAGEDMEKMEPWYTVGGNVN